MELYTSKKALKKEVIVEICFPVEEGLRQEGKDCLVKGIGLQ